MFTENIGGHLKALLIQLLKDFNEAIKDQRAEI